MNPLNDFSAKTKQTIRRAGKVKRPGKRKASLSGESSKASLPSTGQAENNPATVHASVSETKMNDDSQPVTETEKAQSIADGTEYAVRKSTVSGTKKSSPIRLRFEEPPSRRTKKTDVPKAEKKPIQKVSEAIKPIAHGAKEEAETQLSKYEDDNTGLQAAHTAEQAGSSALHTGKQLHEIRQNRLRHQEEKKAQVLGTQGLTFGDANASMEAHVPGTNGTNSISRKYQRINIQREYRAAKAGKKTGKAAGKTGREAVEKVSAASEKAVAYVGKKKPLLAILLLGGMLVFIIQGLSACSPLLEAGMGALTLGTYPAEEADVWQAEQYYVDLEWELQDEMQRYELYHPGYDEYIVDAQEIWHDPYALIALISAYNNGEEWTLDDAIPIMQMFFDWQYEKTETVTTQQRYHTEIVDGVETKVWHTVTICTVTLKNKNLSHAPVYTMSREKVGLYALYMSTHGNMDGLFHGPHVSELKDPLEYGVPQELLDADPKFALLVEEANKRLGYPYVWGGYTPDTSFDCSGFISWIFTETGVRNIGHMGATGLYGISQHISEAELKPGDVIFFSGTIEGASGVTHCALYVGNGMMIHCGNPCSYYDIAHGALRNNICGYGRLYQH